MSMDMDNGMRTIFPNRLGKGFCLKLPEDCLDLQTPVESQKA